MSLICWCLPLKMYVSFFNMYAATFGVVTLSSVLYVTHAQQSADPECIADGITDAAATAFTEEQNATASSPPEDEVIEEKGIFEKKVIPGCVLYRKRGKYVQYLLLQSSFGSNQWSFPKGYRRYTPRHLRYAALLVLEDKTGIKKADVRVIEDFVKRTQAKVQSVLLTAFHPAVSTSGGRYPAIKLENYVLTTGIALAPLLSTLPSLTEDSVLRKINEYRIEVMSMHTEPSQRTFTVDSAYCAQVFICDFVEATFERDLNEVRFNEKNFPNKIFSIFLLFRVDNEKVHISEGLRLYFYNLRQISRRMIGNAVTTLSTPFHNLTLFNSQSRGVISNVMGKNECIFLVDIKLSGGCAGAPVFSAFGELIGTITESVSWCKGEWMGFSVAVHLFPVIKRWLQKFTPLLPEIGESKGRVSVIGDHSIDRYGVVLVSSPRIWGSGVILNKKLGLVVTCSHVVSYSTDVKDVLVEYQNQKYHTKVIYATRKNAQFDLALLKIVPPTPLPSTTSTPVLEKLIQFAPPTRPVQKGEAVYIIGYPLFSLRNDTVHGATVSFGHVSTVFENAMIMVACVSNSGSSGGALVRPNGELIGIVSNNLKLGSNDLLVPHFTVAIPATVFLRAVNRFCETGDVNMLKRLHTEDELVKRIWSLDLPGVFFKSKL